MSTKKERQRELHIILVGEDGGKGYLKKSERISFFVGSAPPNVLSMYSRRPVSLTMLSISETVNTIGFKIREI